MAQGHVGFLRTRVARRVFVLFVASALIPTGVFAVVSYRTVTRQLRDQSQARLMHASHAAELAVRERIDRLAEDLMIGGSVSGSTDPAGSTARDFTRRGFSDFSYVADHPSDDALPVRRRLDVLPPDVLQHLADGNAALIVSRDAAGAPLIVVATQLSGGVLYGFVDPEVLWWTAEQYADLPSAGRFCVLDDDRRPLHCSTAEVDVSPPPEVLTGERWVEWDDAVAGPQMAGVREVFLRATYRAPSWHVVVSEPVSEAMAPMRVFRESFPFVAVLSLLVVVFLSNVQIRRSLGPLEELRAGTKRVAEQEFGTPVEVSSGDEFEELAASFNQMSQSLGLSFDALGAISEIDRAVLSKPGVDSLVGPVISRFRSLLAADDVVVFVKGEPGSQSGWMYWRQNGDLIRVEANDVSSGDSVGRHFVNDGLPPVLDGTPLVTWSGGSVTLIPLEVRGRSAGLIAAASHSRDAPSDERLEQAIKVADQVNVALAEVHLVQELNDLRWGALQTLARAIDAKSTWTAGHSERVTRLAVAIGRRLGLDSVELELLRRGGLLHDVGKIGVPSAILDKPGRLNEDELRKVREHPAIGARILEPVQAYADVIPMVKHHHELLDGSGYPDGLRGDEIPPLVRVLTVADVFDALTSRRPYRAALNPATVVEFMKFESPARFEAEPVQALAAIVAEESVDIQRQESVTATV